ncbi:hypothetical protein BT96DRAFT_921162 [Gymnopus androsaceus JB14]|uniref:F-box domain-containing protein n=1 Tax=Gymnopus androsaceus JB14 TaxID=1447944 RepID=A0A6A4HJY5_9AGAR|nr:hypothetical protein BT96DRAFT_921162 [Gymnopus androsaceus JB14]
MMERRVLNELIDSTLLNCALVGRAWVRSSQRGIFREIVLKLPLTAFIVFPTATRRLDASFSEKPYLASYVRILELRSFAQFNAAPPEHAVYVATASLVRRLSNLNSLSFSSVSWESLPPLLQAALTEICKAPSVTRLSAIHFNISTFVEMASILSCMKNLKVLHINVLCDDWNVPNSLSELEIEEANLPPQSIQLDELRLDINEPCFMDWFQQDSCPIGIPSQMDMATLQYFGTGLKDDVARMASTLNFAHLTNLRCLSLVLLYQTETDNPEINLLFQHLTIGLRVTDTLTPRHWNQWSAFDTLLGKPAFASLDTVDFNLAPYPGYLKIPDGASKLLSEKLPFLEGSGEAGDSLGFY